MHDLPDARTDATAGGEAEPGWSEVLDELARLRTEVADLQRERAPRPASAVVDAGPTIGSRRQLLQLAGASALGAVTATVASGTPAAADDPNDVVKNISNAVDDTTTLDGEFPGPVFSLFNRSTGGAASALYASTDGASPAVRADNSAAGGAAVVGNAPDGQDLVAFGSGRIAMVDHVFGDAEAYASGELHQSDGEVYAMVTPTVRRKLAGPGTAGAIHLVTPTRVYDSRTPVPDATPLGPGGSRVVSVADGRDIVTGATIEQDLVPPGATAILYTLTIADTVNSGFLYVAPASATTIAASTINWTGDDQIRANSSFVGLAGDRQIRVFCSDFGSTEFVIDVLGYCS